MRDEIPTSSSSLTLWSFLKNRLIYHLSPILLGSVKNYPMYTYAYISFLVKVKLILEKVTYFPLEHDCRRKKYLLRQKSASFAGIPNMFVARLCHLPNWPKKNPSQEKYPKDELLDWEVLYPHWHLEPQTTMFKVDVWWNTHFPCKDLVHPVDSHALKRGLFRVPGRSCKSNNPQL